MSPLLNRWEGSLPSFSIRRPITVLVLMATALVVGVIATVGIPLETFPQGFTTPFLTLVVPWQDAPPREVLDKIVIPLEDELSTVRGLDRVSSMSASNRGVIFLSYKQGTDMDVAYREVRDRIERVRPRLPPDAEKIFIRKDDLSGFPVYMVGLAVGADQVDSYHLIQNEIIKNLERVPGVATVTAHGLEQKEILIEVDRQRAEASGLNIYQLAQELQGDNFTMASGTVRSGEQKLLLRSVARYDDLAALRNRRVAPTVRLGDVAEIRYEEAEKEYSVRVNGERAVALALMKEGQANTVELCRRIEQAIDQLKANPRLQNISMVPIFSQGKIIMGSLGTMINSGKIGSFFAVLVLFFFLRRIRLTLIITLSIPLSLVIALTVMYFSGETLNILTLLGLMICVGLLVDNSVVVAENIHRLHRLGLPRKEAAIRGASEISLAIVMATLTTVAVFLPVSLIKGQAQFFLQRLSLPISVSLLASLVVALVFVPLAAYLTLPRSGRGKVSRLEDVRHRLHERMDGIFRRLYEMTFGRLNSGYGRLLAVCLRRRLDVVVLILVALGVTGAVAFKDVEFSFQQESERSGFELDVTLPSSYTLEDAAAYFETVEETLESHREAWDLEGFYFSHVRTSGEVQGWLKSPRSNDLSARQITDAFFDALPEVPGVKVFTGEQSRVSECKEKGLYCLRLYADDPDALPAIRADLEDLFRSVDGVVGLRKSEDQTPSEVALVVDRDRAQRQGVNPQVVAGVVSYALRGQSLPKFYREGREVPVRVRFEESHRESLAELANFSVPTDAGTAVALSTVTEARFLPAPGGIFRRDRQVSRTISLELAAGREAETKKRIRALVKTLDLPEGVRFGEAVGITADADGVALLFALGMSIVFVYLLMTFLFESFILPLSIILTIPLASIGVGWIHFFTGYNLDFLGIVAGVLLVGVVVNNGIVLIDYVNRLRQEGMDRGVALLVATDRRFRPIMMTALTTICATVPLTAGGPSEIGMSYTSFGLSLIGGMTSATLLTLLVVPVFYTLFDDAREAFGDFVRKRLAAGRVSRATV